MRASVICLVSDRDLSVDVVHTSRPSDSNIGPGSTQHFIGMGNHMHHSDTQSHRRNVSSAALVLSHLSFLHSSQL